ncbi:hypothetical protein ACI2UO_23515 [Ralstonia nicotianae]
MTETKTAESTLDDPHLQRILEELLADDENITARAVVRHHPTLKAASSITRSPARSALLAQYQQRQTEFRRWQRRLPHQASATTAAALADKDLRIATLENQVKLLAASHLAMIKVVGELGGFSKWAAFYEHYAAARKQLEALGALPVASVTPLPSGSSPSDETPPPTA